MTKLLLIVMALTYSPLQADPGIIIEIKIYVPEYPIGPKKDEVYSIRR